MEAGVLFLEIRTDGAIVQQQRIIERRGQSRGNVAFKGLRSNGFASSYSSSLLTQLNP